MSEINIPEHVKPNNKPKFVFQQKTEVINLPSKGLCYNANNPLSGGVVEMYYPDTSHEEILSDRKLLKKNQTIDKFLKSLIADNTNFNDILLGDKSALMIASRIMLYGKDYPIEKITCKYCEEEQPIVVDLTQIEHKEIDYSLLNSDNLYEFTLPMVKHIVKFKMLTHKDEMSVLDELKRRNDYNKKSGKKDAIDAEFTTRLKYMIKEVTYEDQTGSLVTISEPTELKMYKMYGRDSFEFRKHLNKISPDIKNEISYICNECDELNKIKLPMTISFFWPDTGI